MLWPIFSITLSAVCLLSRQVSAAGVAGDLGTKWSSIISEAKSEISSLCSNFIGIKTSYVTATVTSIRTSTGSTTVIKTGFSTDTLLSTTVIDETTVLVATTVLTSTSYSTSTSVTVLAATSEIDTTATLLLSTFLTATSYNTATSTTTIPEVDIEDVTSTIYTTPISTSTEIATASVTTTIPFITTVTSNLCSVTVTATTTVPLARNKPKIRRARDHPQKRTPHPETHEMDVDKRDLITDIFWVLEALDPSFASSECSKLIVPVTTNTRTATTLATAHVTNTITRSTEVVGSTTSLVDDFSTFSKTTVVTLTATVQSTLVVVPTSTSYTDITSTFESTRTVTSVATLASQIIVEVTVTSTDEVISTATATSIVSSTAFTEYTSTISFTTTSTSTSTVFSATACYTTATTSSCFPSNAVQNPGFETGNLADYYSQPDGATSGVVLDPANAHSGSYVYEINIPAHPGAAFQALDELIQNSITVFENTDYLFTAFLKSGPISGSGAQCRIDIIINNIYYSAIVEKDTYFLPSTSDVAVEVSIPFNSAFSNSLQLSIVATCSGTTAASTLYIDDFSLLCTD